MQLWRPEFKLDRVDLGGWCLFTSKDISLIVRERL